MKSVNRTTVYLALGTLILGILIGRWFFGGSTENTEDNSGNVEQVESTIWTCSMHPQVRQPEFGLCPLCAMDLIPLDLDAQDGDPLEIKMSASAMQLANIQTSIVSEQKVIKKIRLNGKVKPDERYVYSQTSHISGRIEKLLVNYTGEKVTKGQVVAHIYSPELVVAQDELLEAYKIKDAQPALFAAAKEKLKNWKLTNKQIDYIIKSGVPIESFPIHSDMSGIVMSKRVNLGDHLKQGASIFEVADLSKVWVLLDVYERDLAWVKTGDAVDFSIQSMPGDTFSGEISFIDPIVDSRARVAKARVALDNPDQIFKPEMFVNGVLKSPMKGEITSIVVPKSAVMWTGARSIVYVKKPSETSTVFVMRNITLGASLGDSYVVKEGLQSGEEIATNGTFNIDAAAQLAGKPSMMNPSTEADAPIVNQTLALSDVEVIDISTEAKQAMIPLFESYIKLKDALVGDDFEKAVSTSIEYSTILGQINMSLFKSKAQDIWMKESEKAARAVSLLVKSNGIEPARLAFMDISNSMTYLGMAFRPTGKPMYVQYCSMAFDDAGASWLSFEKEVFNPYFGDMMLNCGEVKDTIE